MKAAAREPGHDVLAPRFTASVRFAIWLGVRIVHVALCFALAWLIVVVTGNDVIDRGVGAAFGLGLFLAFPVTVIVSAVSWCVAALSVRSRHPSVRRIALISAAVMDFAATLFLFVAWTPNHVPIVLVEAMLSGGLTAVLIWAHQLRDVT